MSKVSIFTAGFGGPIDPDQWTYTTGVERTPGRFGVRIPATPTVPRLSSVDTWDCTDSGVYAAVTPAAWAHGQDPPRSSMQVTFDATSWARMSVIGADVVCQISDGGVVTTVYGGGGSILSTCPWAGVRGCWCHDNQPPRPTIPCRKFWRITESNGVFHFWTSDNVAIWTELGTGGGHTWNASNLLVEFECAGTEVPVAYMYVDAVNQEPPTRGAHTQPTKRPVVPVWNWQLMAGRSINPRDWLMISPLPGARSRKMSVKLSDPGSAEFSLNGLHYDASLVEETRSDLLVSRDGVNLFRGRIAPSTDELDGTTHSCAFTAWDYREMLRSRKLLYLGDTILTYAATTPREQEEIGWLLIDACQTPKANGTLGIIRGTGQTTGRERRHARSRRDLLPGK